MAKKLQFPSKPEVRLGKSPLIEVICQVRFARILRISSEPPTDFQEAMKHRFPGLVVEQGAILQLPGPDNSAHLKSEPAPKIFRFKSKDAGSHVALADDFFALSTKRYTHWQDFLTDLRFAENAVQTIYHPAFATRVGLRFVNRFTRKNTGASSSEELLELFRSEFTCLIRSEPWGEPEEKLSQIRLADGQGKLTIRSAFGKEKREPFFLLDFDYYEDRQLPFENLAIRVDRYHKRIYAAFRWCILDDSLERFQPLS